MAGYIELKSGTMTAVSEDFRCILCDSPLPSAHHLLFQCPALKDRRLAFLKGLSECSSGAYDQLTGELADRPREAAEYVFGKAEDNLTMSGWTSLRLRLFEYTREIKNYVKDK